VNPRLEGKPPDQPIQFRIGPRSLERGVKHRPYRAQAGRKTGIIFRALVNLLEKKAARHSEETRRLTNGHQSSDTKKVPIPDFLY